MIKSAAASTHTFCFIIYFLKCRRKTKASQKRPGLVYLNGKVKEKPLAEPTIYQNLISYNEASPREWSIVNGQL
jgi:hypothetical protein